MDYSSSMVSFCTLPEELKDADINEILDYLREEELFNEDGCCYMSTTGHAFIEVPSPI